MKRVDSTFVVITNLTKTKVLLVKSNGAWGFPGGMREKGESLKEAGEREVLEEVGIRVELGQLNSITEVLWNDVHDLFATFMTSVDESIELKLTGDNEISDILWFNIAEASQFMPWYPGGVEALLEASAVYAVS